MTDKKTILFVCTHNSARSQLAEGLVNYYFGDDWHAYSAGTEKTRVKTLAIEAMSDVGIDITHHSSKTFEQFLDMNLDYVVTVCDSAKETCPYFPGAGKQVHVGFEDPSDVEGNHEERLQAFINTRNLIKSWLEDTLPDW